MLMRRWGIEMGNGFKNAYSYPWFKVYYNGWLHGSIRAQLTSAERGVWADFLALAAESRYRGVICLGKNQPIPHIYLAASLNITVEELESTIKKCCEDVGDSGIPRLSIDEYGCLVVNNFLSYQESPPKNDNHEVTPEQKEGIARKVTQKFHREHLEESKFHVGQVEAEHEQKQ